MKLITTILFVFIISFVACSQTIKLGYVWDKNDESEKVKHYDLFILMNLDSASFWSMPAWPADTLSRVMMDTTIHFPNLLATIAHITGPIDSIVYQFEKPMSQNWIRGYILAADSLGNTSYIAPSLNVMYIGDDDPPSMPGRNFVFERK